MPADTEAAGAAVDVTTEEVGLDEMAIELTEEEVGIPAEDAAMLDEARVEAEDERVEDAGMGTAQESAVDW